MAANNFKQLVRLIQTAEKKLAAAGQRDPSLRITTLRGLYYGTPWSKDYTTEQSEVRNWGFWVFTGGQDPPDPRPALGKKLVNDLQASQDVIDGGHRIDLGHVLIGMDARKRVTSRSVPIPKMGGTGLEVSTWLGDLGGGAGNLAYRRLNNPDRSVKYLFPLKGSDYGASINLEGDMGGYLVAPSQNPSSFEEPTFPGSGGVAEELRNYLPLGSTSDWHQRISHFSRALGGEIKGGELMYIGDLGNKLASKIGQFGAWYMSQRYIISGQLKGEDIATACRHLASASREVATTFVVALAKSLQDPQKPFSARPPFPKPNSPLDWCKYDLLSTAQDVGQTGDAVDDYYEYFSDQMDKATEALMGP